MNVRINLVGYRTGGVIIIKDKIKGWNEIDFYDNLNIILECLKYHFKTSNYFCKVLISCDTSACKLICKTLYLDMREKILKKHIWLLLSYAYSSKCTNS